MNSPALEDLDTLDTFCFGSWRFIVLLNSRHQIIIYQSGSEFLIELNVTLDIIQKSATIFDEENSTLLLYTCSYFIHSFILHTCASPKRPFRFLSECFNSLFMRCLSLSQLAKTHLFVTAIILFWKSWNWAKHYNFNNVCLYTNKQFVDITLHTSGASETDTKQSGSVHFEVKNTTHLM